MKCKLKLEEILPVTLHEASTLRSFKITQKIRFCVDSHIVDDVEKTYLCNVANYEEDYEEALIM